MSDFLDHFGDQLRAVQVAPSPTARPRPTWLSRASRRGVIAGLATLIVAGPALAITQPWSPTVGRPGVDRPVHVDSSPVTAAARGELSVLRRPQTADDRAQAAPLLRGVVGDQVDGVQVDAIRSLKAGWALVPAKSVQTGPSATATDQLCFTNGEEITCGPAPSLSTTGVGGSTASATKGETTYTGLVPDGVSGVRFTPKDGKPVEVAVASNFYELVIPQIAPSRMMDAPAGFEGPARIPAPPAPVSGTLQWLDSHGAVVGPQQPDR
ncbi:MAG: hypothetical protein JWP53_1596 [Conexibacter sp.]|jgi:hypothetical protein|nr:hypothetical protein [Conexibacter sp.]